MGTIPHNATIRGYQVQWRPHDSGAWRIVAETSNAVMASALDSIPDLMRTHGDGNYRIVRINSRGEWSVRFFAAFGDTAAIHYGGR